MTKTYAQVMSEFAADLAYEDIPDEVVAEAKMRVLDILGLCLVTCQMDFAQPVLEVVRQGGGPSESMVIGTDEKFPVASAALANGTTAHGLDYDDTHILATAHCSSCVVPTVLAVAEREGSSGRDVITAAVVGWETMVRIGIVAPGLFAARGFHPTSIAGPFAAALAAGKLMGLSSVALTNALGISGSFSSGLGEFVTDGSWVKRMHAGWAAQGGITAASLASRGFTGPSTIFEGEWGLFRSHLHGESYDLQRLTEGLRKVWETLNMCYKPYPACHLVHAFMDCVLELKRSEGILPEDVDRVLCRVAEPIVSRVCEPLSVKKAPPTDYDAKFSLPFSVAVMLADGKATLGSYSAEKIADPLVLDLAGKVEYEIDPDAPYPQAFPGWVEIYAKDGRKLEYKLNVNRGSPEFPMTPEELQEKFRSNAKLALPEDKVEEILEVVDRLEELPDVSQLMGLCHP